MRDGGPIGNSTCKLCNSGKEDPVSYRFGDPVDMGTPPSLNLREFGGPRVDLGTPLSIDVSGCTAIDPKDYYKSVGSVEKQVMLSKATCSNGSNGS